MVVHLFLNNNKALDFLPINSIKNGGITVRTPVARMAGTDTGAIANAIAVVAAHTPTSCATFSHSP
jgi:hypothetical protein